MILSGEEYFPELSRIRFYSLAPCFAPRDLNGDKGRAILHMCRLENAVGRHVPLADELVDSQKLWPTKVSVANFLLSSGLS